MYRSDRHAPLSAAVASEMMHPVERFVVLFDAFQNLHRVVDGRFVDADRLEAAFQRGVFLDMFAVLGEGGCADDLDFAAGQRRFQHIGGVHRPFGVACADQVVHLVDEQDDIARPCGLRRPGP